jgi:energy-coupling factor transporter ATP-binding protein EcfA2
MTPAPDPVLTLRDWSLVRRGTERDITILDRIDLEIRPACWLAVLGANGSGKSSLLKYLASDDSPLADAAAIMFQDPDEQIFAASVTRELTLGRRTRDCGPTLTEFGLEGLADLDPRLLSAGQKQRLVLAVALGIAPRVLLCDEPTALQDPAQSAWVLDRLERWKNETGGALVTATCDRAEAERADHLVVLDAGRILCQGPTAELLGSPAVEALLGNPAPASPVRTALPGADPLLELQSVRCRFAGPGRGFGNVTWQLGPGGRLGITGPNGCGKSTLLAVCAGVRAPDEGTVRLNGQALHANRSSQLDHGTAMLAPQFPEYLFTRPTVAREIRLDPVLAAWPTAEFLAELGLPTHLANTNPHDLSCGQKRRLALGLVLLSQRPVLLLDEPTAALDRRGRALVLDLLERVAEGTALVIASHDREFLAAAGCRILELGPEGLQPASGAAVQA